MPMLALTDPAWDAYPDGLRVAEMLRALQAQPFQTGEPGDGSVWSLLWTRLADQGEIAVAAYAAVPHLVEIGSAIVADDTSAIPIDYLHLPAWIEIARLTVDGAPDVPPALEEAYHEAIRALDDLAIGYALRSSDAEVARVVAAAILVARGDATRAEVVLDWDDDDIAQAQQYLIDGPAFGVN